MIPTSEETFARNLEMLDRVTLTQAVEAIRADSVVNGTDNVTMEEIDAEVAAVRNRSAPPEMKRWVIDTTVLVSALLNPYGPPARVLDAVLNGRVKLVYDARILAEYRDAHCIVPA